MGIVSLISSVDQSPQNLVAATDQLLYRAKQSGRNQIAYDDIVIIRPVVK
jgi:PleD family two-component response regulator